MILSQVLGVYECMYRISDKVPASMQELFQNYDVLLILSKIQRVEINQIQRYQQEMTHQYCM